MLESLQLTNVGAAEATKLAFAPGLNLVAGHSGLGKSFLLDTAWWALSWRWPRQMNGAIASGYPAMPTDVRQAATIRYRLGAGARSASYTAKYSPRDQDWLGRAGRPCGTSVVVYALADGGFAVWDPCRNFWRRRGPRDVHDTIPAHVFSFDEVWHGRTIEFERRPLQTCQGILYDWSTWIRERGADGARMAAVLRHLSSTPAQPSGIDVGDGFARLSLQDARDVPTIRTPYGASVSSVHAARGVRRIISMAYVLAWAWRQHLIAAERLGEPPARQLVVLVDDVEAHLDERWQRRLLRALLEVGTPLTGARELQVQILAATHTAAVVEAAALFATDAGDRLFHVELADSRVHLAARPWAKAAAVAANLRAD